MLFLMHLFLLLRRTMRKSQTDLHLLLPPTQHPPTPSLLHPTCSPPPLTFPPSTPSPDSSHSSAGSPLAPTSLPNTDQADSGAETSLAGPATYPHAGQDLNCNFYEYMHSSFPAYQHQSQPFYPTQINNVSHGDLYQTNTSYLSHYPYNPYLYSNRPYPHSNLYNGRQMVPQDLATDPQILSQSTPQPLNMMSELHQNTSTTVQHPADSSTDHTSSSSVQSVIPPSNDPAQKYPPVLIKGGGKIRAKPVRRTEFSAADLRILEEHFAVSDFARGARRDEIARQLNVRPRSITIWFQNKRAKLRARNQQLDLLKKAAETGVVQDFEKISDFR
ncbi:hypothetical protein ACHWQZ_G017805 [Mnemiopsis leidyi]